MGVLTRANFRFLYRELEGRIDRRTWWIAVLPIVCALIVMTAIWIAIMPPGARDLTQEKFFDAKSLAAYAYLLVFALAILIGFVMIYHASAKRLTDRGLPQALAGLPPFALFLDGAMHWLAPRAEGAIAPAMLWTLDVAALAILVWTIIELGLKKGRAS